MANPIVLDAGPLVALLCPGERGHAWVIEQFSRLEPPLLTCEAVISEADHLIRRRGRYGGLAAGLLQRGVLRIGMQLAEELKAVEKIQAKYRDVPVSLADACLVRMSELYDRSSVMTFDEDFRIYRRHGRQVIPLLIPDGGFGK